MHHMKKATVRDLRYKFRLVEDLLNEGEEIQITKRKRVIARLLPPEVNASLKRPDFLARLKKLFRGKHLKVSSADLISVDRDRF
jgi:antitoxin (DNA-binding transcriptional repressor) of toxin-antitoxin stability system